MSEENIFFDTRRLKYRGSNVIIGKTVRMRYPELVELHDNCIVDDFTYISCGLTLGAHSVIEPGCVLTGGQKHRVTIGAHAGISSHTTAYCSIHDFKKFLHTNPDIDPDMIQGDIVIEDHAGTGAYTVILPGIHFGEGARTMVNTAVTKNLEPWTLYSGSPARGLWKVDRETVLKKHQAWLEKMKADS